MIAATLEPQSVAAWNAYVTATEARWRRELADGRRFLGQDFNADEAARRQKLQAGEVLTDSLETLNASALPRP